MNRKSRPTTAIFGVILGVSIILGSVVSTTENHMMYFNFLGLMLVVGGTCAVAFMTFSFNELKFLFRSVRVVFFKPQYSSAEIVNEVLRLASVARADVGSLAGALQTIEYPFAKDAVELVVNGLPPAEVKGILKNAVAEAKHRELMDASICRTLSKYPPAFGMMGTLIGLIAMMQGMGVGSDILKDLGPHMSVALVATFYGIMLTNIFLLPMAESIEKAAAWNARTREMVSAGVLMIQDRVPLVLIRERLRSYLPPSERSKVQLDSGQKGSTSGPRRVA